MIKTLEFQAESFDIQGPKGRKRCQSGAHAALLLNHARSGAAPEEAVPSHSGAFGEVYLIEYLRTDLRQSLPHGALLRGSEDFPQEPCPTQCPLGSSLIYLGPCQPVSASARDVVFSPRSTLPRGPQVPALSSNLGSLFLSPHGPRHLRALQNSQGRWCRCKRCNLICTIIAVIIPYLIEPKIHCKARHYFVCP